MRLHIYAVQDEGAPAALRLVALPAPAQDHQPLSRGLPGRQAGVPAHRRGGEAVRRALRDGRAGHRIQVGRDRLDPRDPERHEPRDGGHERPQGQDLPGVSSERSTEGISPAASGAAAMIAPDGGCRT